jgi:hypothetical protein
MKTGRQNRRTQRKGRVTAKYQRLEGQKARTKKVQSGGGLFWTSNEEEIARFLAHSAVQSILPSQSSLTGKSKSFYILSQQRLHDYLAAMLYRLYKLHKNESFKISGSSNKVTGLSVYGKIKKIFEIPVKATGKEDYGRKLYERTDTSKDKSKSGITTDFLRVVDFLSILNKSTDTYNITTHDNAKDRICQKYSIQSSEIQLAKYIEPVIYKIENGASTSYALFGVCNNNQLSYKVLPNIIYKYRTAVSNMIALYNKSVTDKNQIKQIKQNYESVMSDIKNRVYLEDMATALFYYAMYKNTSGSQSRTSGYTGYGYGGYGYGGYQRW